MTCPSGKTQRFRDELAAKMALARMQSESRDNAERREKRIYPCPLCKGWHTTSTKKGSYRTVAGP